MALIAFCAMALVENVTNAQPVRREEGRKDGRTVEGRRGRQRGEEEEEEDKKEQKQDKRVGHVVAIKRKTD